MLAIGSLRDLNKMRCHHTNLLFLLELAQWNYDKCQISFLDLFSFDTGRIFKIKVNTLIIFYITVYLQFVEVNVLVEKSDDTMLILHILNRDLNIQLDKHDTLSSLYL